MEREICLQFANIHIDTLFPSEIHSKCILYFPETEIFPETKINILNIVKKTP